MPEVFQLGHLPIKDHSFSPNRDILAITKEDWVEVYLMAAGKPQLFATLKEHDKTVTAVDISPDGTKILTCSQDRNALVWEWNGTEFKPTLVLLRINRAATCCRWSPDGRKFAVGSLDRVVAVCYYEEENNWWVSKHLKKPMRSTITCIDWHPNGVLLAAGGTDGHARVFSAYIKGLDAKPEPTVWGLKLPFQTLCGDFENDTKAWIHGVAFSPLGNALGYAAHDGTVTVVYPGGEGQPPRAFYEVKSNNLPFKSLTFINDSQIVAGGHSCNLVIYQGNEQGWKEGKKVENDAPIVEPASAGDEDVEMNTSQALHMFKQMDLKGRVTKIQPGKSLPTTHQNTITAVRNYGPGKVSTSGADGKIVIFSI